MKEEENSHETFDLPELWRELQDFEDGTIDPHRREELMTLLKESPRARLAYFEYFQQSAIFKMEGAKMEEAGRLPIVTHTGPSPRLLRRSLMIAAAVTALLAVIATLIVVKTPAPGILQAKVAAETRWEVNGESQESGAQTYVVLEGSTVRVLSGTLGLTLESGTALVMQGPARVSFPKLTQPVLEEGWLWVDSGEEKEDFAVEVAGMVIRDVGTRFGIRVPRKGPLEVHLVEGMVEVTKKQGGAKIADFSQLGKAFAIAGGKEPEEVDLAPDPFPELANLLVSKANYHTTVLSQSPLGYWTLDESGFGEIANEVPGGVLAGHGVEVKFAEPGPGRASGFGGFREGNRSMRLLAHEEKSLIIGLSGPSGVSRREGAVAFWIKGDPGRMSEQALWLAGESTTGGLEPEEVFLYTSITRKGRVNFAIENSDADVMLTSTRDILNGRWHHIVASWGPSSIDLYVDGNRVARDSEPRDLMEGLLTGRYVRLGKAINTQQAEGVKSFDGWVDEIALWNRALTHPEVAHQFESARGK